MSFRCNAAVFAQQGGDLRSSFVDRNIERRVPGVVFRVRAYTVVYRQLSKLYVVSNYCMMKRCAIVVILHLQICTGCYENLCGFCVPGMMQRRIALYVSCIHIRAVFYE